ncbi:MAG: helix-turn-helix domain-containing protein [Myxococcales bacterium]|nr:helix-turn-helix domain-containing protein [Myxococcales bacterium]
MSIEQLAIDTKIPRASIEALEEDRFGALPGPVFVKGFFRCCARSLELDAETVLSLLHEHERALQQIKSGRRERQTPHLLGRGNSAKSEPARADKPPRPAAPEVARTPAAAGNPQARVAEAPRGPAEPRPEPARPAESRPAEFAAAVAGSAPAPSLFSFDALLPALRRVVLTASNSRLLMWIAIGLMIAVIAMTAFMMVGGPVPAPRS